MGVVGLTLVLLNADAVGVVLPLVGGGQSAVLVDDHLAGVGKFLLQSGTGLVPDLGHLFVAQENTGDPLGGGGLAQGHGQHIPGCFTGAVEDGVEHHHQGTGGDQHNGEQQQQGPAYKPAEGTASFLLLFLLFGLFSQNRCVLKGQGLFICFAHVCYLR